MSKMDALRAMREARYAERAARAPAPAPPPRTTRAAPRPAEAETPPVPVAADTVPCGHRNMGGRTCTREQGHAAKSHRYS
jgi:hypothetical protein